MEKQPTAPQDQRKLATQRRLRSLFEKYKAEGLDVNDAAARALEELKRLATLKTDENRNESTTSSSSSPLSAKPSTSVSPAPSTENTQATQDAPMGENNEPEISEVPESYVSVTAAEMLNRLETSDENAYVVEIGNILSIPKNMANSFRLENNKHKTDWDGLRRFYDTVEEKSCKAEKAVVDSIREFSWRILKQKDLEMDSLAIVMTLVNPHIASPAYLEASLPSLCNELIEIPLEAEIGLVRAFSKLDSQDLIQIVQNLQQAITIRCLEIDTSVDVHRDDQIISYVRTLRLCFFAALVEPEPSLEWKADLQSYQEKASVETMDIDEETEEVPSTTNLTEDELVMHQLLHSDRETRASDMKDELCRVFDIDWIKINRPKVPFPEFVNDVINNALNVEHDFVSLRYPEDENDEEFTNFSFFHHPFILNTQKKTVFLFYDSREKQVVLRRRAQLSIILRNEPFLELPYLIINVSRENIIQDTLIQLEMVIQDDASSLQKQFMVQFDGEQGVDEGGVSKEFFTLVLAEILRPDYGMFQYNEDTGYHQFNPVQFQDTEKEFLLIGMILGLAIYNSINLDINLSTCIFKKLLGRKGEFHDLEFAHPDVYRSVTQLLEADKDTVESMCLTFSVTLKDMFGEAVEMDLVPNGVDINVTAQNKFRFVELYADFLLNKSIDKSFNAFQRGFQLVTQNSPLKQLFRPEELEALVIGQRDYDWDVLEETCEYDGGFSKTHDTIKHFWSVVNEMEDVDKKKLLEFYTGSDRVPVGGLARLRTKIQRSGPDSERLPTAHTCFNILLLPAYIDREKLKIKLFKAMENAKGFGMI